MLSRFSFGLLFATLSTVAPQAPLSMEFSRKEYWGGWPCPCPGDLPDAWIKPMSLMSTALAGGFFTTSTTWETSKALVQIFKPHVSLRQYWEAKHSFLLCLGLGSDRKVSLSLSFFSTSEMVAPILIQNLFDINSVCVCVCVCMYKFLLPYTPVLLIYHSFILPLSVKYRTVSVSSAVLVTPTPVFLPREFHGWRSLVGFSPQGCKESDTTEWFHFTSYCVTAWRISETGECWGPAPAGSRGTLRMMASAIRKVKRGRERGLIFLGLHRKPIKLLYSKESSWKKNRERKREKRKEKNDMGRPSFGERGP